METARQEDEPRGAIKAIAATSGGLDSVLAAVLVRRLGIDVILLHVQHLFCASEGRCSSLRLLAERLGLKLRIVDATVEHLDTVRYPKHGYGVGMNPCVDCRIFLMKVAKQVMEEEGAEFVITGEVLGQRPKSQHYRALLQVSDESGLGDRLLRPLSANLLPDALPITEGWIRREDLPSIQGRSRQHQMTLAEALGITDYPQPAGGCVLTEKVHAARVRDAFSRLGKDAVGVDEFRLLRIGRQFRFSDRAKVIIGRNQHENDALERFGEGRIRLDPVEVMGPTALIEGEPSEQEIGLAAALTARYCDLNGRTTVRMSVREVESKRSIDVEPLVSDDPKIGEWRIGGD